jgi:phosphate uptake regulator
MHAVSNGIADGPEVGRAFGNISSLVREQLAEALHAFEATDPAGAAVVIERDDVVDNCVASVEEHLFEAIRLAGASGVSEVRRLRGALRVLGNLERIGDAACHIAKHAIMMAAEPPPRARFLLSDLAEIALVAVDDGVTAFQRLDIHAARTACERERELDEVYVKKLHQVTQLLDGGNGDAQYLVHVLATMKYLEKTADFVLNIGEAVFFSLTGTRLKYPQFKQLETLLAEADRASPTVYRHFWDGLSGAVVLEVDGADGSRYLFKEGGRRKIDEEIDRTIDWEELAPLRTPRLIGRAQDKDRRAVLREFAAGTLYLDILLAADEHELKQGATQALVEALLDVWSSTLVLNAPRLDYAHQIRSRLREILRRHPELEDLAKDELQKYGGIFGALDQLARKEPLLAPPFSVWSHGDLNANNVVYDVATRQIVFIDVHRSRYGDYVGDIGVLLTSTFRQFPRKKVARSIEPAHELLVSRIADFAATNGDPSFQDRLKLARARALMTSARLTDDADRAEVLFAEGLKYLKKVARRLRL